VRVAICWIVNHESARNTKDLSNPTGLNFDSLRRHPTSCEPLPISIRYGGRPMIQTTFDPHHQAVRALMDWLTFGRVILVWSRRAFSSVVVLGCLLMTAPTAMAQLVSGYGSLPGFSENTSPKRIGDAHRFEKAQNQLKGEIRPEDEIWLISTRQLCQSSSASAGSTFQQAEVARWSDGCWQTSSSAQLLQEINADQIRSNLLFVHGNRTDLQWANLRGVETYERIILSPENVCHGAEVAPPIRWIIWAWNSDPINGPRLDLAVKKQRAIDQGSYLAEFFQAIEQPSMGVFAYSLGAQALTSALRVHRIQSTDHAAASAVVCGGPQLDVVMVAAAVPTCWFHTEDAEMSLPACVSRLTLINNPEDRALKVYQRFTQQHPIGLNNRQLAPGIRAETYLVAGNSLDNHYLSRYMEHPQTRLLIRQGLLPETK
jgi:hypothetical protein